MTAFCGASEVGQGSDNVLAVLTILAAAFAVFGIRAFGRAEREAPRPRLLPVSVL